MNISALSSDPDRRRFTPRKSGAAGKDPAKIAQAAEQFEGILLRQILNESMKPLLRKRSRARRSMAIF